MGNRIRVLSEELSNKIAAGEVVERPASVVKELIDNSIDASARNVVIEIRGGGRRYIKVSDDGSGMSHDDAILAFERHATSKISSQDDLYNICTLGFRGEALPSIASISILSLITSTCDAEVGTRINIEGGVIKDVRDAASPTGTSVEVKDIFFNTPARLKFMKSDTTELSHISSVVTQQSLAHPSIHFKMDHNKKTLIDLPLTNNPLHRLTAIFGRDLTDNLIEIEGEYDKMRISGFISRPTLTRSDKGNQYVYVNSRYVKDKIIGHAIYDAYRSLVPRDRHPMIFLFLSIDPGRVDVNVHPSKVEVRFSDQGEVHDFVCNVIRNGLHQGKKGVSLLHEEMVISPPKLTMGPHIEIEGSEPLIFGDVEMKRWHSSDSMTSRTYRNMRRGLYTRKDTLSVKGGVKGGIVVGEKREREETEGVVDSTSAVTPKGERVSNVVKGVREADDDYIPSEEKGLLLRLPSPVSLSDPVFTRFNPIGQIDNSFIIMEGPNGIVLLDQHTAHERVLYERLIKDIKRSRIEIQQILIPVSVEMSKGESLLLKSYLNDIMKLGLEVEDFGQNRFLIRAVPALLVGQDYSRILLDIVDKLSQLGQIKSFDEINEEIILLMACHGAIKANQHLGLDQIRSLMRDLEKTELPYTCPHGRPIALFFDMQDIRKRFMRR
ncbi:MAG: DNA mismatch repair endonuclease MutL [Nitrospinae bacterium]|nr:DNA mismatch repair endonuclease MutL [Nitrospinota bacterium]